jgi:minor extracellular serine protease Vpr
MKSLNLLIVLMLAVCFSSAQNNTSLIGPKLSAGAKQYLWKLEHEKPEVPYVFSQYVYRTDAQNKLCISAIIKVQPGFTGMGLDALGVRINTKAGDIWTAQVPVESFRDFMALPGIKYIEMDQPAVPLLDSARSATHVDSVHAGIGLPLPYTGKNVVVGVIDAGFDYSHPTFYDTAYQTYRVKRVWEEKTTGTPPAGFFYGKEYADSAAIQAKSYDIIDGSHGTHVGGIAGGSGYGGDVTNSRYRGMAYNSDLAFVAIYPTLSYWLTTGMADMLDGANYIYSYAQSVGKPAVANLSWGCPLGPRDGSSLFSQGIDNLTGAGKIFVLSGGNNGTDKIHVQKTFTPSDISFNTFLTFSPYLPEKVNRVDVWGDSAKSFAMKFILYNNTTRADSTTLIYLDDLTHDIALIGSDGDTCFITLTAIAQEFNGKPHMLLDVKSKTTNRLCLNAVASDGTINLWQGYVYKTSGYYGTFTKYNYAWAVNGDNQMQTGDLTSSRSVISVAAYNSKVTYTNSVGQSNPYIGATKGGIASFSSRGPTADGRTKPDIAGPGLGVASAVNSADSSNMAGGADFGTVTSTFVSPLNGRTYPYAVSQGTSMAAPAVSGIVALLMEANPGLTPAQTFAILKETAITDSYTGVIPTAGSTTWGFGKVNAYAAIKKALETTGIYHSPSLLACLVYPNPGTGQYALQYAAEQSGIASVLIYDVQGKLLQNEQWPVQQGNNLKTLDLGAYAPGIYIAKLSAAQTVTTVTIYKQ